MTVLPRLRLGDVALVLLVRARRLPRSMSAWLARERVVRRRGELLARRDLALRARQLVGDVLQVEQERPRVIMFWVIRALTAPPSRSRLISCRSSRPSRTARGTRPGSRAGTGRGSSSPRRARRPRPTGACRLSEPARSVALSVVCGGACCDVRADLRHELRVGGVDRRAADPACATCACRPSRARSRRCRAGRWPTPRSAPGCQEQRGLTAIVAASVPVKKAPPALPARSNPAACCVLVWRDQRRGERVELASGSRGSSCRAGRSGPCSLPRGEARHVGLGDRGLRRAARDERGAADRDVDRAERRRR